MGRRARRLVVCEGVTNGGVDGRCSMQMASRRARHWEAELGNKSGGQHASKHQCQTPETRSTRQLEAVWWCQSAAPDGANHP